MGGVITVMKDVIDLTLSTNFISQRIVEWKVSTDASCSDHRYIEFAMEAVEPETKYYRNPKCTDWTKYEMFLADKITQLNLVINSPRQLDRQVENLVILSESVILNPIKSVL